MHCGTGVWSKVYSIEEEVNLLCKNSKSEIESKTSQTFTTFEAVQMKKRVMRGMDYLVKIKVDNDQYLHVLFIANFDKHSIDEVITGMTLDSPII